MQGVRNWVTSAIKAVQAHTPLTVGFFVVVGLLIGGYNIFQALDLDANDIAAVSGAVAAIAGCPCCIIR